MSGTINAVTTIEALQDNNLLVEVLPNTLRNGGLQFYYLSNGNPIKYTDFNDFNKKVAESLKKNNMLYITFCGISDKNMTVPEYLYLTFFGKEVEYKLHNSKGTIYLEFKFNKSGQTLESEIRNLFTNNIGVFIQIYL